MVTHRHGRSPPATTLINPIPVNSLTEPPTTAVNTNKNLLLEHLRTITLPILPIRRKVGNKATQLPQRKHQYQAPIHPSLQKVATLVAHQTYQSASEKVATFLGLLALTTPDQKNSPVTQNDTFQWMTSLRLELVRRVSFAVTTTARWTCRALNPPACRICQSAATRLKASFTKFRGKRLDRHLHHRSTGTCPCSVATLSSSLFSMLP